MVNTKRVRGFERVNFIHRVNNEAGLTIKLPTRNDLQSCGYDIYLVNDVTIEPNETSVIFTDVKVYMQPNEYLAIHLRSSVGIKYPLVLKNGVGIIDASYYDNPSNGGNIALPLYNYGTKPITLKAGSRIAQGIFNKYCITDDDTVVKQHRTGGLGSSGE
jgi:dUTP pyrophosphatase